MPLGFRVDFAAMHAPSIIDVEASGFGRGSYPIEIGFVTSSGESWCALIQPQPGWQHWEESAEQLHGISREVLARHGRPVAQVAREINERLKGQTVYSDGWGNDFSWLGSLYDEAEISPSFRLHSLRELLTEAEAGRWHAVKSRVAEELDLQRHRASGDAKVLQLALMRIKNGIEPCPDPEQGSSDRP